MRVGWGWGGGESQRASVYALERGPRSRRPRWTRWMLRAARWPRWAVRQCLCQSGRGRWRCRFLVMALRGLHMPRLYNPLAPHCHLAIAYFHAVSETRFSLKKSRDRYEASLSRALVAPRRARRLFVRRARRSVSTRPFSPHPAAILASGLSRARSSRDFSSGETESVHKGQVARTVHLISRKA